MPSVPSLQSAVYAQAGGKWLLFGGRTNGLHGFNPTGLSNFPPLFQNPDIIVIDPATGQTWTRSWASTGLPPSVTASLSSTNQEFYQEGDRLYAVGGYSFDPAVNQFRTYDTLSSIGVSGLIDAVINGGDVAAQVRQSRDPRPGGHRRPDGHDRRPDLPGLRPEFPGRLQLPRDRDPDLHRRGPQLPDHRRRHHPGHRRLRRPARPGELPTPRLPPRPGHLPPTAGRA